MKPLLSASRVVEQEKAKKAAIAAMETKIAAEVSHLLNQLITEKTRSRARERTTTCRI